MAASTLKLPNGTVVGLPVPVKKGAAKPALAWGGHRNGKIPTEYLRKSDFKAASGHAVYLHAAACMAFDAMVRDAESDGVKIRVVGRRSAYRTYQQQVQMKKERGGYAARPGYSNHGWALAADLVTGSSGAGGFNTPFYRWMEANAHRYGYVNPAWARRAGRRKEPWHWEWWGADLLARYAAKKLRVLRVGIQPGDYSLKVPGTGPYFDISTGKHFGSGDPFDLTEYMMQKGDSGPAVAHMQARMQELKDGLPGLFGKLPTGKPDGKFGPGTEKLVKAFQKVAHTPTDGVMDGDDALELATWLSVVRTEARAKARS